jgi:hypothetical protein
MFALATWSFCVLPYMGWTASCTAFPLASSLFTLAWIFRVSVFILSMLANSTSTSALSSASAVLRGPTIVATAPRARVQVGRQRDGS